MHRTLNTRFLLGLVLASLLVSAGLGGLYVLQAKRRNQLLFAQAEAAVDQGRPDLALRWYQRYLRVRPDDVDTLARYGLLLDDQAHSTEERVQALQVLGQVLRAQPQQYDLRRRVARRALEIGQFTVADQHLQVLLADKPDDSEVESMLGQCALARKDYVRATTWLEKAIEHAPQQVDPYLQLAALQNKVENPERRGEVLDALVAANPKSHQAYLARGLFHLQRQTLDRAAEDIARARALAPQDVEVLTAIAKIAIAQGSLDRARECLDDGLARQPQQAELYLLRAELERRGGQLESALSWLRKGLTTTPEAGHDSLRLPLADVLIQEGRLEEAQDMLKQLRAGHTPSQQLDLLEARLLLQKGQWDAAADKIQLLSESTAPTEAALVGQLQQVASAPGISGHHLMLGMSMWMARGASTEAETSLRRAYTVGDGNPDALVVYLQYLARTGRKDKAEQVLDQARLKGTFAQAVLPLAHGYELLDRLDQAGLLYDDTLATVDKDPAVLRAGAEFYLRHNNFARAIPHLRRLLSSRLNVSLPTQQWARRNLAIGLAFSGTYAAWQEAEALLSRNRDLDGHNPEDRRPWAIVLSQHPTRRREAIPLFEKLRAEGTLSIGDRFLLVQLYEAQRDWTKARRHLESLLAAPQGKTADMLAYAALAELHHGTVDRAQAHLAELAKREPDSFRTAALQARLARARGDSAATETLVSRLLQHKDTDLSVLASVLEELGQVEAADKLLRIYASRGKPAGALLVRARFLGRQQRLPEALDLCGQAWITCDPSEVASVAVALVHSDRATPEQLLLVEEWLDKALDAFPQEMPLLLALAEVQDLQRRYPEAIACYRKVLSQDPGNIQGLNNLAWLLAQQEGQADEALTVINKALKVGGPSPHLLDTRAMVYLATGASQLAVRDLEEALAAEPSASRYYHLARIHWVRNERQAAEQALQKARAEGLTAQHLHVSERSAYQQLVAELGPK